MNRNEYVYAPQSLPFFLIALRFFVFFRFIPLLEDFVMYASILSSTSWGIATLCQLGFIFHFFDWL